MRRNRSCTSFSILCCIDQALITPLDPIAFRAVVARSEGQGLRRVFQQANTIFIASRLENVCRRRSLALDGSEHDGTLMANRDGGLCSAVPAIITLLFACMITAIFPNVATADERDIGAPDSIAIAVSSAQKLPSARLSAGTSIADRWAEHIAEAAQRFAIPELWIRAVMTAESDHDPHAISPKGAMGLMQIMPATWEELRTRHGLGGDPYDPRDNILAGAAYLAELHDLYGSPGFLAAYNAGPRRYEKHLDTSVPLPAETVAYVARIMAMIDSDATIPLSISRSPEDRKNAIAPIFAVTTNRALTSYSSPFAAPPVIDLSALAPLSDGLFIPRSGTGVAE